MTGEQQHQHSEGAVSDPVVPSTGAADAEWEARLEALRQLADTDAASAREQAQAALEELRGQQRLALESRFA
ncbi:MAG: hypothetical protein ACK54L_18485, partial [Betaproteobacteria bacterium]